MADTTNTLSATDRKQLCKITEGRFEMLREQINSRWNEITTAVRDQVMSEHEADIKQIRKELRANDVAQEKLETDKNAKEAILTRQREDIIAKAQGLGLNVSNKYNDRNSVLPKNVDKAVTQRVGALMSQYKNAKHSLRTQELSVLEKISVAGLQSDQAKDFLGEIPNIDNLLPAADSVLELQS